MARVIDKFKVQQEAPIERILGQKAQIRQRDFLSISNFIYSEVLEVNFPQNAWPDEHARLNLFPIADGQFCLQILYLLHSTKPDTANITWLEFQPQFFEQYPLDMLTEAKPFHFDKVTEEQFTICAQTSDLLQQLVNAKAPTAFITSLKQTEAATHLLRRAMECIALPFASCPVPACRFLANDGERDKIVDAQKVIQENLDSPLTIKELSRAVAMNECYLKKGFKALVGKTIHEYTQELRIAQAKHLLQHEGLSVSDVANSLGYSSISHFSTAFKKATGTKPCELLR